MDNIKIALSFRFTSFAQTLLNVAIAPFFGAIFRLLPGWVFGKAKATAKATRHSLRSSSFMLASLGLASHFFIKFKLL